MSNSIRELLVNAIWEEAAVIEAEIDEIEQVVPLQPALSGTELEKVGVGQGASLEEYEPWELSPEHLERLRRTAQGLEGFAHYVGELPETDPRILAFGTCNLTPLFRMRDIKKGQPLYDEQGNPMRGDDYWPISHETKIVLDGFREDPADARGYDALLDELVKAARGDHESLSKSVDSGEDLDG